MTACSPRERADDLAARGVGERGEQRAELGLAQARHSEACAESAAMRGPTTGARLRSTTTRRVPPTAGASVHSTRESPQLNDEPPLGLDLLDRAPALLAVLEADVDVAALLGLELDLVGRASPRARRGR